MKVLLTNDDGIYADGIKALIRAFEDVEELHVIAPDRERSATGHGITVHRPLRVEEIQLYDFDFKVLAVDGTPSDCVKLAVESLLDCKPDIVISGINRGYNIGTDVLYSGTVSAAIEGVISGIPSMAISLAIRNNNANYFYTAQFTRYLASIVLEKGLPADTLLNVNMPPVPIDTINEIKVTSLSTRRYENVFDRRVDPRGRVYYWLAGEAVDQNDISNTDYYAIKNNAISITPIHFDLTKYDFINTIESWNISLNRAWEDCKTKKRIT